MYYEQLYKDIIFDKTSNNNTRLTTTFRGQTAC